MSDIKLEEFQQFLSEEEVLYASSARENKRLYVALNGNIRVMAHGRTIYKGVQPYPAVEAYNNFTEKYVAPKFQL
jgi:hypothetical protein